jgi:phenylacetate-CoA ligase
MRLYARPVYYLLRLLKNIHINKEDLARHQFKKLKQVIKNSYDNVPYYNRLFKENNIRPDDIDCISDLNKLPIITKNDMRENIEYLLSKRYDVSGLIRYSTSGSTGIPLPVYVDLREDDYRKAKHLRSNIVVGQRPWDSYVCITTPSHFGEIPSLLRRLGIFSREYISVFEDLDVQIEEIERIKPDLLTGYSSSLYVLAREVEERGVTSIRPKLVLGGAELSDEPSRRYIEKVFDAPFIDQYAIVELEKISWQCMERNEYHIDADSVILQFVDKNGEEVSEGERGEIVCTSLFNYAMPFIRYNVGDIGIPSGDECACGIKLPLMKMIEGRKDSMLVLPGNRLVSPRNFNIAMNYFDGIRFIEQFRVIQKKIESFKILLKLNEDAPDEQKIIDDLTDHMYKTLKLDRNEIGFDIKTVDDVPKDKTGKLRAIISEI